MINVLIFGDKIATKLHRRFSNHHVRATRFTYLNVDNDGIFYLNRDIKNKVEAAIDWESARFTKPEKPLNAYQTWKTYYSDIDMYDTVKSLGFLEE